MRNIINKLILTLLILTCVSSVAIPVYADTDGTELQVVEPQKLEIQLGQSWAGVEFTLKTDAGMYPNAIPVDETGVLKLEIGGICLPERRMRAHAPHLRKIRPHQSHFVRQLPPDGGSLFCREAVIYSVFA